MPSTSCLCSKDNVDAIALAAPDLDFLYLVDTRPTCWRRHRSNLCSNHTIPVNQTMWEKPACQGNLLLWRNLNHDSQVQSTRLGNLIHGVHWACHGPRSFCTAKALFKFWPCFLVCATRALHEPSKRRARHQRTHSHSALTRTNSD